MNKTENIAISHGRLQRLVSRARGTAESYYAIRIGDWRRRQSYFMLQDGANTPALFVTRAEALKFCPKQSETRIVKVWLRDQTAKRC